MATTNDTEWRRRADAQLAVDGLRIATADESGWYCTVLVDGVLTRVWATNEAARDTPIDPRNMAHYLAALTVAGISPASVASSITTTERRLWLRCLIDDIAAMSIPDAALVLRSELGEVAS